MYKTPSKHKRSHQNDYDLYNDLAKIRAAISDATYDAKGLAKEVITQSLDEMREKTAVAQENFGTFVANRPYKAVGIAMFAGWLLGYLMRK